MANQFDAFEDAQGDLIEVAVREILRADEDLNAFFGGRFVRPPTPMDQRVDVDIPHCIVTAPKLALQFQFQEEAEDNCPVLITVVWSESEASRARDIGEEKTAKSLVRAILVALWANQRLAVEAFDEEPLVEALVSISEVAFGKFYPEPEDRGDTPYRWCQIEVVYRYTLDLVSGGVTVP